jgi:signal transduction histidine kinase
MGLGLAIVKQFVEAHGGSVSVDSVIGVGSTFRFNLPNREASGEAPLAIGQA